MFRNHLNVALRNAWRNRRYTAINVFGLAVGVSCCLLIGLYVLDEIRYDRFWPGGERVFRINQTNAFEEESTAASVAVRVGPAVAQGVTGVVFPNKPVPTTSTRSSSTNRQRVNLATPTRRRQSGDPYSGVARGVKKAASSAW